MRYAETHRLLGSILVGVCHTDLGDSFEAASGYYEAEWQWQRIRDNQQWIAVYSSSDDPHIPDRGAAVRRVTQLKCSHFEFTDRGHFIDDASVSGDRRSRAEKDVRGAVTQERVTVGRRARWCPRP